MGVYNPESEEEVVSKPEEKTSRPPLYRVLLHNDDYTTMEFVVEILMHVFHKPLEEATRVMLSVHHNGIGVCGVFTLEVAETKVDTVHALAKERGFPLKSSMERE